MATGWYGADPLLSAGIGLLILYRAWRLPLESIDALMEETPGNLDVEAVRQEITSSNGVTDVHDAHRDLWRGCSIDSPARRHASVAARWHAALTRGRAGS